jgi:hypothetical protein
MTKQRLWLALLVLIATLTQCSSCKENVNPDLPPETQTGAGTFACRVNGQVWIYKDPTDIFSSKPTTTLEYDPNNKSGSLDLGCLRYDNDSKLIDYLVIYADSLLLKKERIILAKSESVGIRFYPQKGKCSAYSTTDNGSYANGRLLIIKLDDKARIISGRFDCSIYQPDCGDTLKITEGRFDFKF